MNINFRNFILVFLIFSSGSWSQAFAQEKVSETEIMDHADTVAAALDSIEIELKGVDEMIQKEDFSLPAKTPYISMANHKALDILIASQDPVESVLNQLSVLSGMDIVFDEAIDSSMSLFLKDVNLQDAFRIIIGLNRLAYFKEEDVYRVMSESLFQEKKGYSFREDLQVKMYKLDYADPLDMVDWIDPELSLSGKIISVKLPKALVYASGSSEDRFVIVMDKGSRIENLSEKIEEYDVFRNEKSFILKYGDVRLVAQRIKDITSDTIGEVEINIGNNELTVQDIPSKLESVVKLVSLLDKNDKQLFLNIKVLQVILDDQHKDGVDWKSIVSDCYEVEENFLERGLDRPLIFGTVTDDDSMVLMDALGLVGDVNFLEDIKVVTKSGRLKKFNIKSISKIIRHGSEDVTYKSPISFYLKSHIMAGDIVRMGLSRDRQIAEQAKEYFGSDDKSKLSMVEFEPGKTIIIGGLMDEVLSVLVKKDSVFGNMPFLKKSFEEQEEYKMSEIIIFISSYVKMKEREVSKKKDVRD